MAAKPSPSTGLVYDARMKFHAPMEAGELHPEDPRRIWYIFEALRKAGCVDQCLRIDTREACTEEVLLCHDEAHHTTITNTQTMSQLQLEKLAGQYNSLYLCPETAYCARLSCGGLIELCRAVVEGQVRNGFAVIRPPGHHAERIEPMGFCFYNNVAIATRYVQSHLNVGRVLIVDWDIHHGNGIQEAFIDDPDVLYFSIHRHDNGNFYPESPLGDYDIVGLDKGAGFNVNVPWPCPGMGDGDYLHVFDRLLLPMAREFAPELVIVASGFDAAKGDTIGECLVTPSAYAHMTYLLKGLAGGRVVLALEGGYNLDAIASSALACVQALLNDNMDGWNTITSHRNSQCHLPNASAAVPPDGFSQALSPAKNTLAFPTGSQENLNTNALSTALEQVASARSSRVGPSLPQLSSKVPSQVCLSTVDKVIHAHQKYWRCLGPAPKLKSDYSDALVPPFNLVDAYSKYRLDYLASVGFFPLTSSRFNLVPRGSTTGHQSPSAQGTAGSSLSSVVYSFAASQRQAGLSKHPLTNELLKRHTIATTDFSSRSVMVLFVHDSPDMRALTVPGSNVIDESESFAVDSYLRYDTTFTKLGYGVIDVCVPYQKAVHDPAGMAEGLNQLMLLLWDTCIDSAGAKTIIFVGSGAMGCQALTHLISYRGKECIQSA
ncbi:Histone deacetylase hda1 [Dimargaris verticillata]|uniref:histone deacetylase n=1 Tax=Dimargaris verticillata TaxID=2761393 RepID=A0A9W8BBI2_9FUNG|nr:Histone deacetylase hda1 [Dimargaris verticillata]